MRGRGRRGKATDAEEATEEETTTVEEVAVIDVDDDDALNADDVADMEDQLTEQTEAEAVEETPQEEKTETKTDDAGMDVDIIEIIEPEAKNEEKKTTKTETPKEAKQPGQEKGAKQQGQESVFDKIELEPFPTKFETFVPKLYTTIEITMKPDKQFVQIGCLNSATGEVLHTPFVLYGEPGTEELEKAHRRIVDKKTMFIREDGTETGCYAGPSGFQNFLNFLRKASGGEADSICLVLYSNAELKALSEVIKRRFSRQYNFVQRIVKSACVYENNTEMEKLPELVPDESIYSANKVAEKLRDTFMELAKTKTEFTTKPAFPHMKKVDSKKWCEAVSWNRVDGAEVMDGHKSESKDHQKSKPIGDPKPNPTKTGEEVKPRKEDSGTSALCHNTGYFGCVQPVLVKLTGVEDTGDYIRFRYNLGRSTKTLGPAKILRCMDDAYAFLIFNRKEMGKKDKQSAVEQDYFCQEVNQTKFMPADQPLAKFFCTTAAELTAYHDKINKDRKEKGEKEFQPMFSKSMDMTVEVRVGGKEDQKFVVKKASMVPVNLKVKDQEDVVLCLKDVLLFSQDRDKKLGVNVITSVFSIITRGVNKAGLLMSSTGAEATLTSGDFIGTAVLVDAERDNTFIAKSAMQGDMVTKLFQTMKWSMDPNASKETPKQERNKKRPNTEEEAPSNKKAKPNQENKGDNSTKTDDTQSAGKKKNKKKKNKNKNKNKEEQGETKNEDKNNIKKEEENKKNNQPKNTQNKNNPNNGRSQQQANNRNAAANNRNGAANNRNGAANNRNGAANNRNGAAKNRFGARESNGGGRRMAPSGGDLRNNLNRKHSKEQQWRERAGQVLTLHQRQIRGRAQHLPFENYIQPDNSRNMMMGGGGGGNFNSAFLASPKQQQQQHPAMFGGAGAMGMNNSYGNSQFGGGMGMNGSSMGGMSGMGMSSGGAGMNMGGGMSDRERQLEEELRLLRMRRGAF